MLEHPDISTAQIYGYQFKPTEPICFCDRCGGDINEGDDYYDTGNEFVCKCCMSRCRRTAGEELPCLNG